MALPAKLMHIIKTKGLSGSKPELLWIVCVVTRLAVGATFHVPHANFRV
jgi:hypothetical protein